MKRKYIISILTFIATIIFYLFWANGTIDPKKRQINDGVFLEKNKSSYSIYCEQPRLRYGTYNKLIATTVDSIIVSYKYGTLFRGFNSNNEIEWFYVDNSAVKNIHSGFININDATSSTMGEHYIDSIITVDKIWSKY